MPSKIKIKASRTKDKYLHIEVLGGTLYIYSDDSKWNARIVTRKELEVDCDVGRIKPGKHIAIPLQDYVK